MNRSLFDALWTFDAQVGSDDGQALDHLRLHQSDPLDVALLRRMLREEGELRGIDRLSDREVLREAARLMARGRLAEVGRLPNLRGVRDTHENEVKEAVENVAAGAGARANGAPPPAPEPEPEPSFTLNAVDDHFAPGKEKLIARYDTKHLADKKVVVEITGEHAPENPIYQAELTPPGKVDGTHTFSWDGTSNKTTGPLAGRHINPLWAPFKITFKPEGLAEAEAEFKVLYHSIELALGTYTADGQPPPKAELIKWVQYKLNELGYFSGPVDGVKGAQTTRAIKRYTYERPGLKDMTQPGINEIDDENHAAFQTHLENGDGQRRILEGDRLPRKGDAAKAYIDHDYFYHEFSGADFSHPQGHGNKDAGKLDRFELPLEVTVRLVSKSDDDGSRAGVVAPEGIGAVDVEWFVLDPVEDTSFLPTPTANIPSRGKAYVEAALTAVAPGGRPDEDKQDNCSTADNGVRGANKDYFRLGDKLPPFRSEASGDRVYAKVHQDKAVSAHKLGRAGILFRGSYIAGDNYALKARLSFDRQPNKDVLKTLHEGFWGKPLDDLFVQETGTITLWRRQRVMATIDWPNPSRAIDWGAVADAYELAHADLDTAHRRFDIENLLSTEADKNAYLDLVSSHFPMYNRANMRFNKKGLYPLKVPAQGLTQDPDDYRERVWNLIQTFTDDPDFQDELADVLYKKVCETEQAGTIIFRPNWVEPVKVRKKLPLIGIRNPFRSTDYMPGFVCLGLPFGVALMDNGMTDEEQDGFLYAHEMGHCRYLQHHQTDRDVHDPSSPVFGVTRYDTPDDHDLNDHNCTMCYPDGIASRPGLSWNKGDVTEARFCGKCLLKLRGWKVAGGGLPAQS